MGRNYRLSFIGGKGGRCVNLVDNYFSSLYYGASEELNSSNLYFEEYEYITTLEEFDNEYYEEHIDDDESIEYYNSFIEKIEDEKYIDFIRDLLFSNRFWELVVDDVVYLKDLSNYDMLTWEQENELIKLLNDEFKIEQDVFENWYFKNESDSKIVDVTLEVIKYY